MHFVYGFNLTLIIDEGGKHFTSIFTDEGRQVLQSFSGMGSSVKLDPFSQAMFSFYFCFLSFYYDI